ncbi:MAG: InlB B-repeat-containing protein [Spirochaetales bacterium]|nr:InlB B-repeat-containing protein [Spirochaetales bacterium]
MKDDNKPKLFIYILLTVVFVVLIASCGGGGGGGGGMVAFAPDNNMPNNGGDAGGWGTGTDTGGGGIGGSSVQEDNATLLLGQSAALSYQKVDIDLVVNGEHFAINNVTATTTTEVLPNIPLGATVSGTATIYLINGTTRTALLEMTEIGIHNNLVFKVPYNYTCVDASSVAEITSGTYFSRDGIDLSSFTNHPIIGWKCQEDGSVHAGGYITGVRGDITLEPLFDTGVIYNITYVSPITSQSVPDDTYTSAASKTLPVLSESNLTFAGWYDNQSYNGQPVATIPLGTTGDKVYYAKWTAAVTFNGNGGVVSYGTDNVTYNSPVSAPPDPTKSNYTFDGWYTDSACTVAYNFTAPVTQNITLYANWNPISHGLTFRLVVPTASGATSTTFNQHEGRTSLPSPTCTGLSFAGWYSDPGYTTAVASIPIGTDDDVTLYAKWTATVTFDGKGGQVSYNQGTVIYNNTVHRPDDPTKTNYVFGGWYTDSACTSAYNFDSIVTNSFTLYAKWNPVITYVSPVTLPAEFQPGGAEASYDSTSGKTLSSPTYTGLNFAGWFEDAAFQTGRKTSITQGSTAPITYYAKWTVAVAFNPNGGGGSTDTRNVVYGTKTTRPATHPTPPSGSNATFDDWYTGTISGGVLTLDSTAFDFDNTVITETTVLYARWVTTISFNANGGNGSFPALNNVVIGSKITVPSPGPTKNNCVFTGWYKNSGCAEADRFKFSDPIDKGMTLYAGWQSVYESGTRNTYFVSNAGISITDNADGDTTYCLRLNNDSVSGLGTALAVTNNKQETTTTAYLDIQGTNSFSAAYNHGGLKLTTSTSGSKSIKIVFCTSSSGTITLYGGRGCIQVENVTATFELMAGCKATEMKIGSTTYTDFNSFVNAMKNESFSSNMTATLKIERE